MNEIFVIVIVCCMDKMGNRELRRLNREEGEEEGNEDRLEQNIELIEEEEEEADRGRVGGEANNTSSTDHHRIPSTVHVLFSHGQPHSLSIVHDHSNTVSVPTVVRNEREEGGEGGGEEEESSTDSEDENFATLHLLARLLGGNLRRR